MEAGELIKIGRIRTRKGIRKYVGDLPETENEVAVVQMCVLEKLLADQNALLLTQKRRMNEGFYKLDIIQKRIQNGTLSAYFPDVINWTVGEEQYKLFLERHFYSADPSKDIWIRYASVEQMNNEENPEDVVEA